MKQNKNLQDMSLEELWQLFPINLVPYNPSWPEWAENEIGILHCLLNRYNPVLHHIGSTAIPGIYAKPIVDILVETLHSEKWPEITKIMEANGYILMACGNNRMSFNKGYTIEGYDEKVFHIHFHISGDCDEVIFRDFLIGHPSIAKEYERLKLSLLPEYRHKRDDYTAAKSPFIRNVLLQAANATPLSCEQTEICDSLAVKINLNEVKAISRWASLSDGNKDFLWRMSLSDDRRTSVNSMWALTHMPESESPWLRGLQPHLIIRLLSEQDISKKRILLQLLREQDFDPDSPLTIRLLDYCFSKINSECEPYAIRCFSIYVAYKICRSYPELISELEEYLNLLSLQALSPGLKSALRQTRQRISKFR